MTVLQRFFAIGLVALVGLTGCSGDDDETPDASPTTAASTSGGPTSTTAAPDAGEWDAAALDTGAQLAEAVSDGGVACDEYQAADYGLIAADYKEKLPLPLAMTFCTGPGGEDFTFEVFADAIERDNFMATKLLLICTGVEAQNIADFPGLPYVEGDTWLVEPDEEGSANRLAELVDGEAKVARCPS